MDRVAHPDMEDPNPDVWELFRHYDGLYFRGALAGAGFAVQWSSPRITGYFGSCTFRKTDNTITLSEPVLKYRSNADLKNALLHMMIHAILYVKLGTKDRWHHGPIFRAWMDAINSCPFEDHQRPRGGYNITTRHDFSPEESCSIHGFLWKCESCGDTLVRATKLGPPSDACCIENVDNDTTCGNILCHWHKHKMNCGDTYANEGMVSKSLEIPGRKKVPKGTQSLLADRSEMSKSQRTVQESDSAELQENATVRKPIAEGKLLSLVGVKNAKSPGSTSSKKAGKRHRPENVQKASGSKKAGKQHEPEDIQKTIALPAPQSKLKKANEISSSNKAGKQHKPEGIQKTGLVASQKDELYSIVGCSNAKVLDSSSKKEFAVISAWLNYYESEGSSGSTEPLVNKRTERRKRARNHSNQITYSRSRKRNTRGGSSIKTQPPEDSSQQSQPRSPCLDIVILPADLVVTQAPGVDQSQPPAPCLDIVDVTGADQMVPLQSTDPPCSTPSNPSIGPDVIDISDDD